MKAELHPQWYPEAQVICACGETWNVGATVPELRTDVCSRCHPYFTGEQRIVDTEGQVDRFMRRLQAREDALREVERREILLGRTDAARGIFPQLDLTADEGSEQSVSRRHARIFAQDGACYIEDLDSTNGTFLNGTRLKPHQPYAIRDGDALTVGKLDLLVQMRPQD